MLTTSEIKSGLQVVICRFVKVCAKLSANADDKDCDPEFGSLLNRKPGKKQNIKRFMLSVIQHRLVYSEQTVFMILNKTDQLWRMSTMAERG